MGDALSEDAGSAKKPPGAIFEDEVHEALPALKMPLHRLALSGVSAGMDVGFSLLLMAIVRTMLEGSGPPWLADLAKAACYPFGFIIVVLGRSELFTEQTSLAVLPLLSRQTTLKQVGRLWGVVFAANVVGGAAFALIVPPLLEITGLVKNGVFGEMAREYVEFPWWVIFWSGSLTGWLMGLLSWLVAAGRDTISQIVTVWLIAFAIGLAHLHHPVVGASQTLAGVFWGPVSWPQFGHFLLWAGLGSAFGGPVFVALVKYGQAHEA